MGYAYNELVAPAVLYANPGITREEFVELLDDTYTARYYKYLPEQAWEYYDPVNIDRDYHGGLRGLARILKLSKTEDFFKSRKVRIDENGLPLKAPNIFPPPLEEDYKFVVYIHRRNVIGKPEIWKSFLSYNRLKPKEILKEFSEEEYGLVTKIIREQFIGRARTEKSSRDLFEEEYPRYQYDLIVRPVREIWKTYRYKTEERLSRSWPMLHPDKVFDWKTASGNFLSGYFSTDNFRWRKKEGRYFLDEITFDLIPASIRSSHWTELGYTDLILTKEAIKHNAWKLLSYRGKKYLPDFLEDFPEAKREYERAVWDAHTSLSAKLQGLTISDFLRFRILKD